MTRAGADLVRTITSLNYPIATKKTLQIRTKANYSRQANLCCYVKKLFWEFDRNLIFLRSF